MKPTQTQQGFTLIELIVVIVILGILAATALPKVIDLSSEAETAAVRGVAGGLASASALNYGGYKASNGTKGYNVTGDSNAAVCVAATVAGIMQGGLPAGYYITRGTISLTNRVAYCKICKDKNGNSECDTSEPTVENVPIPLTS